MHPFKCVVLKRWTLQDKGSVRETVLWQLTTLRNWQSNNQKNLTQKNLTISSHERHCPSSNPVWSNSAWILCNWNLFDLPRLQKNCTFGLALPGDKVLVWVKLHEACATESCLNCRLVWPNRLQKACNASRLKAAPPHLPWLSYISWAVLLLSFSLFSHSLDRVAVQKNYTKRATANNFQHCRCSYIWSLDGNQIFCRPNINRVFVN